ncbi:MAG: hypothetical protein ACOCXT_00740 [Candidatus Dojkabacteria bacterium]
MAKSKPRKYFVHGIPLVCPICNHNRFFTRETLMNTPGMSLLGWDWANKAATNFICERCTHILWFVEVDNISFEE